MDTVEQYEHEGIPVRIVYDYDAESPFKNFTQAAELVGFLPFARDFDVAMSLDEDRFVSVAHAARWLTLCEGYLVAIPFRFQDYGSSGYRTYLTDTDDESAAGFVCVSPEGIALTGAPDPERAAREDFETFRQWIEGEVYGYIVAEGTENEESLWCIYDGTHDLSYVKEEANEIAADIARERLVNLEPPDVAEVLAGMRGAA